MPVDLPGLLALAVAMIGSPGPANMVMMASGARFGLRASLPFVAGVALSKQFVIWPLGLGLLAAGREAPWLMTALKWVAGGYVLWLAWRIAGASIAPGEAGAAPPGFAAGLIVHPLNPKAWAMITAAFAGFADPDASALAVTAAIAAVFLTVQLCLHPVWTWAGSGAAALVSGRPAERWLMLALAALTVASVALALIGG